MNTVYENKEGNITIDVRLQEKNGLIEARQAILFGKAKSTINEHIKNIHEENELSEDTTMKKIGISEFQQKAHNFYNRDVIISAEVIV